MGVAGSDVEYNALADGLKGKGEFRFLRDSLRDGGKTIHQGVYAVTSSGKFLGKIDTGWPHYDAVGSLANLRKAKRVYDAMGKSARVGEALGEGDRSIVAAKVVERGDGLRMAGSARHYDFEGMVLFDQRHPVYSKRDEVVFSKAEVRSMLPEELVLGAEGDVGYGVVRRLLEGSHFQFNCEAWWEEHIREKNFRVKVLRVDGDLVYVSYVGSFFMDANSQWNKSSLRGKVLGKGVWNVKRGVFDELELVSLGDVAVAELKKNMHRGKTKETRVAGFLKKSGR